VAYPAVLAQVHGGPTAAACKSTRGAAVALFRYKRTVMQVIGASALLGLGASMAGI